MKKLSLALAALLLSSPAWAKVRITVEPSGRTATIKYATDGEKVRAFALDITVDKGVIVDINDFIQGESTKDKPGYGIFPANFARYITVNADTGEVAKWNVKSYTPVADPCDPGALPKSGLGTYGITVEMGALYYPPDDSSVNAPPTQGKLFKLTLSEQAKLTIKTNEARGGIVFTNANAALPADIDLAGATNISIAGGGIAIASTSAEYDEWVAVGKPACWTFPRQCHGDADGQKEGNAKDGYSYVGMNDMKILLEGWMVPEADVIRGNGICADFAHDRGYDAQKGFYRVGPTDLNVLVYYWMQPDAKVPADCGGNLKP
jgi:hypothetical protein